MNLIGQMQAILHELRAQGAEADDLSDALMRLLSVKVKGTACRCGTAPLMRFELLNKRCEACRLADLAKWSMTPKDRQGWAQ